MTQSPPRVAVLGSGIMGTCTALFLARLGAQVTIYDAMDVPLNGPSRWNEGKIHLGYLYGADPTLSTARMVLPGGLSFQALVENLLETSTEPHVTERDDVFLAHRDSVVGPDAHRVIMDQVSDLVRSHPNVGYYPGRPINAEARPLSTSELADVTNGDDILAGYHVPERSMNTRWLSDQLVAAMEASPRITLKMGTRVEGAAREDGPRESWRVATSHGEDTGYDVVVNALWNGRMAIDRTAGLPTGEVWSNRYRVAAFIKTARPVQTQSAVVCVGAFGDVKNFGGTTFYVSWYPEGLLLDSAELDPDAPTPLTPEEAQMKANAIRDGLGAHVKGVDAIFEAASEVRIEGGFVFAEGGKGRISEANSTLHARDHFGVRRQGGYISVDTGKWSSAPLMAHQLAHDIMGLDTPEPWRV